MTKPVNDFSLSMKIEFPQRFVQLWDQFAPYTMVPKGRFLENLALIQHFGTRLDGAFVECGTWRGGMAAAMIALGGPSRYYHFFDSFAGLPPAREIDGPAALAWQADTNSPLYFDNCRVGMDEFIALMRRQPIEPGRVAVHKGWFKDTVPHQAKQPLAVLRLDGDWYDSTLVCLEHLYPRVQRGGIVLVDDYDCFDGCSRAVHDYLSHTHSVSKIERTPLTRAAYLLKLG